MQFSTRTTPPGRMRAGCALVPVLAGKELTAGGKDAKGLDAKAIDTAFSALEAGR